MKLPAQVYVRIDGIFLPCSFYTELPTANRRTRTAQLDKEQDAKSILWLFDQIFPRSSFKYSTERKYKLEVL